MTGRILALALLSSAAARADKAWLFEPGQALVSVEIGPSQARLAATSRHLTGRVIELTDGGVRAEIHVALASFGTGYALHDARFQKEGAAERFPEIVFEGNAPAARDGKMQLAGTLTLHGTSRTLTIPVEIVRAGGYTFGHAKITLHLREFGYALPDGISDEVRIELDAGLRPEGAVASRG